jgi:hypothetical protein
LKDLISVVKKWTLIVSDAVYLEASSIDLPGLRATEERDESYVMSSQWPISGLPLPLQTLIIALKDLKEDIVRDKCRQISNYENKIIYNLESAVSNINCGLQKLTTEIEHIVESQEEDLTVAKELGDMGLALPSKKCEWRQYLLDILQKALLKECPYVTKIPVDRPAAPSLASSRALKAAEESKNTRERLRALAEGPLVSLFEHSLGQNVEGPKDLVMEGPLEALSDIIESQKSEKIKRIIRHFERNRRNMLSTQRDLLDASVNVVSKFIKNIKFIDHSDLVLDVPNEMKIADSKIQTEIKFIIQTLSVNMKTLDLALKHIKQCCSNIEAQAKAESMASYCILATKWKLQILDSYASTRAAYKML